MPLLMVMATLEHDNSNIDLVCITAAGSKEIILKGLEKGERIVYIVQIPRTIKGDIFSLFF